MEVTTGQEKTA